MSNFGRHVREHRLSRGMTVSGLASSAGISRVHLSGIENGHRVPSAGTVFRLIAAFDLDPRSEDADVLHAAAGVVPVDVAEALRDPVLIGVVRGLKKENGHGA